MTATRDPAGPEPETITEYIRKTFRDADVVTMAGRLLLARPREDLDPQPERGTAKRPSVRH